MFILEKDKKVATIMLGLVNYDLGKYQRWYADQVLRHLDSGALAYDVEVDVRLSAMKPLQAKWINEIY